MLPLTEREGIVMLSLMARDRYEIEQYSFGISIYKNDIPPTRGQESLGLPSPWDFPRGRQTQALPPSCWRYIILFYIYLSIKKCLISYLSLTIRESMTIPSLSVRGSMTIPYLLVRESMNLVSISINCNLHWFRYVNSYVVRVHFRKEV